MNLLDGLQLIDLRDRLPHADWRIGTRPATTSLTIHYNGPAVPEYRRWGDGLIEQLINDANWQMRAGWGGTINGAPHLMYHIVVGADGQAYLTADITEMLWHCAHADGNTNGLSLHFALGQGQEPTAAQLRTGLWLTDVLVARAGLPRSRVLGHLEWKHATACPGPILMRELLAWRMVAPTIVPTILPPHVRRFQINPDLGVPARVRQAPRTRWDDGNEVVVAGRMKPGTILFVDVVKDDGEPIGPTANKNWIHMARVPNEQADLGFVSETLGTWLD